MEWFTAADGLYKKLGALVLHHSLGALKSKSGKTEEWGVGLAKMVEQYIKTSLRQPIQVGNALFF